MTPRKDRWFYTLFGSLFVLGLILLLLPFGYDAWLTQRNQQAVVAYEQHHTKQSPKTELIQQYNRMIEAEQLGGPLPKPVKISQIQPDLHTPLGYIDIPAVNVDKTLIYYGDSDWALNHGAGTMPHTSLPAGGKDTLAVVTGHSGLANRIVFDNIRYLKNGDVFYLNTFGTRKAYRVYTRKVVDPNDKQTLKAVYVQPGKDRVALLTCTPLFINTDRLLVYGERISLKAAAHTPTHRRDLFRLDHIWVAAVLLFMVILVVIFIWQQRRRKGARHEK
ncbi:class C sortase [Lacticaseibacillus salsurivasis]|uniref:class C sortase n=1 Tax=Lacticaseibacillus salsurivasis TaxID=3081441 RepID=UPI0030C6ED44